MGEIKKKKEIYIDIKHALKYSRSQCGNVLMGFTN